MENIYDDLENYEEANIIEDLKKENSQLKEKLEQYSNTINHLQIDFDNLDSEYKKLELNYSSLLKTAKAEIERKTNMITQLNIEKDMMIIKTFQNKERRCFNNVPCNNNTKSKNTGIERRPKNEDGEGHCKIVEKWKTEHLSTIDTKENDFRSKRKVFSTYVTNHKKPASVPSQLKNKCDDEHIHQSKDPRVRDNEMLDKNGSKSKHCNTSDGHQSYHDPGVSTKSDADRHSDHHHRQGEKPRRRRHRSRSPPADRFSRRRSPDRRLGCNDSHRSANRDLLPGDQIERPLIKHKQLPHSEEPSLKKVRVDSYGEYAISEKSCADGEFISFSPALTSPEDPLRSCQSPDSLDFDAVQSLIKEIIHTATTPQDDPRITSKKYIVQVENGKEVLKSISSSEVYLRRVDPLRWGIPKVIIPDALLQKPPAVPCLADNLQTYSELNHIGSCIPLNPIQDHPNWSNGNLNSKECITGWSSSCGAKKPDQTLVSNSCKPTRESKAKTSKKMPILDDAKPREVVSVETIEGDLLLSDEASDNADKTPTRDQIGVKPQHTKSNDSTLTYPSSSNSCENEGIPRLLVKDEKKEFDNKTPVDQDHVENLPKYREVTDILSKDTVKDNRNTDNRETIDIISKEATTSSGLNEKEVRKNVELEHLPDKTKTVNTVKIPVEILKNPLNLPSKREHQCKNSTDMGTKFEKPKKYQEPKRKQIKVNINHKKDKKKKLDETKLKECDKGNLKNPTTEVDTITPAPDSRTKFGDLFGESGNSLIMPEDLGIRSGEAVDNLTTNNAPSAVDLALDRDPSLTKENVADAPVLGAVTVSEDLTNGTVICRETKHLFENIKPAMSTDSPDVVIISTGVQSKLAEDAADGDVSNRLSINTAHPLTALATSTPLKDEKCVLVGQSLKEPVEDEAGVGAQLHDVPDVRIFVKRRRKIKKL